MEYCLDTGDLEMVKKVADLYPIRCFSMNPSIAVNCLRGTGRTFLQNAKMIREVIGEDTPFYLEAMGDTAEEMIEDAHKIRQEIKGNIEILQNVFDEIDGIVFERSSERQLVPRFMILTRQCWRQRRAHIVWQCM